jgi:hypothetical protein
MATSSLSLERFLHTPELERVVPRLDAEVLHRVVQHFGLEQCGELVALASRQQIARILDADLWQARAGADAMFDVERFGVWLAVLMQSGVAIAADKIAGIDRTLVVQGLSGYISVFDHAAVSSYVTLDGQEVGGRDSGESRTSDIGGYVIEAKRTAAWDDINALLLFLEDERPDFFHALMHGCVRLSHGAREADGFHNLLEGDDQALFEVASDRAERREALGYVAPADARAFLHGARHVRLDSAAPPDSPLTRAYDRALDAGTALAADGADARTPLPGTSPAGPETTGPSAVDIHVVAVVAMLVDAGVLRSEPPRLLLPSASTGPSLALVRDHLATHPSAGGELAYLANTLVTGTRVLGREFTAPEAADAAAATCNLGLEQWPHRWAEKNLVAAFGVGWQILYRDVCLYAARRLSESLTALRCRDRGIHLRVASLRVRLSRAIASDAPWQARDDLDVLLSFDPVIWGGLVALISECPVINAAVRGSSPGPASRPSHSADSIRMEDFGFIASERDVALAHRFVAAIPHALG